MKLYSLMKETVHIKFGKKLREGEQAIFNKNKNKKNKNDFIS